MNEVSIAEIKNEINTQLADPAALQMLCATTFKGLTPAVAKTALLEGMIRGYKFVDFLQKNVYAVPFGGGYSLVTSIDYSRKIGMKSGIVGVDAPTYEEVETVAGDKKITKIVSCTVTVKRKVGEYVGDFTATVYFDEYNTGRNQWATKPRTMIAKVAEMHALRKACPEELSQSYTEEEYEKEKIKVVETVNVDQYKAKLEASKTLKELGDIWADIPGTAKKELETFKNELKKKYENPTV